MIFAYEIPLLLLLLITAGGAILVKDLISAVLLLGSYSFFLSPKIFHSSAFSKIFHSEGFVPQNTS